MPSSHSQSHSSNISKLSQRQATSRKTKSAEANNPKVKGYLSLLPRDQGGDLVVEETQRDGVDLKSRLFDAENAGFSQAMTTRNMSKIQVFAKDLSQMMSIPTRLRYILSSGIAHIRYSRAPEGYWYVEKVEGDQYVRALVYEALKGLKANNIAQIKLSQSEYSSVRISVHYESRESHVMEPKSPTVKFVGNHIEISYVQYRKNQNWQLLAVQSGAGGAISAGVNLLGVALVLGNKMSKDDPRNDLDIKKLRQSPAFVMPIGR